MLSIAKIASAASQLGGGYGAYLEGPKTTPGDAYLEYAGGQGSGWAAPFWACEGPALLGLSGAPDPEQLARLAAGFHPLTGGPLVKGAGDKHVVGLDMTFSAPKDFSAAFAGADGPTRAAMAECLQAAARDALAYAERAAVTRHGHAGASKQFAEAAAAYCVTHCASRALDPQLHVHALLLNVGKRAGSEEWSALEQRPQFERKMATGALFRASLAKRLAGLGFEVVPDGPYFQIAGISDAHREAFSSRSREIDRLLREAGVEGAGPEARQAAALASRERKAEPPLPELLARFSERAAEMGLTPEAVATMRAASQAPDPEPLAIDREALLAELTATRSCATAQEALALICERAMGKWSAAECLIELEALLSHEQAVPLGLDAAMSEVFTTKATLELEADIERRFEEGKGRTAHAIPRALVDAEFDRLESELRERLGVEVSLSQQREAAIHAACKAGSHALVVGWAGAGKTTMLKAAAAAMRAGGLEVFGCCQSAAAAQNLTREAAIPSRTIASLMLAVRDGRARLGPKSVLILDEAGMVGSREFAELQRAALEAGAKLVGVGDPKQLQPIEAGGVFASLARIHGAAEISQIQRQRTDFEPLLRWMAERGAARGGLPPGAVDALRSMPEDARHEATERLRERAGPDAPLARAVERWRARYDFEWMREAVEDLAEGRAREALVALDARGRLAIEPTREEAVAALMRDWAADKTPLDRKAIVAATRADVAEINDRARAHLISKGAVDDAAGIDVETLRRDGSREPRRFAPGDRVVFTKNERTLGVANGAAGTVKAIERRLFKTLLVVELDDPNLREETAVRIPSDFGWLDHAYCLTNHKAQGRTFDSARALANPSMLDREWAYVACSRSRFATTLYADASGLGLSDPESHRADQAAPKTREDAIRALAARMSRSRAKGTTLDFEPADATRAPKQPISTPRSPASKLAGSAPADISRPAVATAVADIAASPSALPPAHISQAAEPAAELALEANLGPST